MCLLVSINVLALESRVEQGLARFVADVKAHNYHQTKKLHSSENYYDMDSEINAYVFTYILPNSANNKENKSQQSLTVKVAPEVTPESFLEKKQKLKTLRQQHADAKEIAQARNELRKLEKQMRQRDRFVTIVISASLEKGPVLDRYFGLPHHVYKQGLIKAQATKRGRALPSQAKVIMLSPQELYFSLDEQKNVVSKSKSAENTDNKAKSSMSLMSINNGLVKNKAIPQQVSVSKAQAISELEISREWKILRSVYLKREVK
jgi:hypothetical protein